MVIPTNSSDILVVVKASPQPSRQYGDTVCVAGITVDRPRRWMRLYPVPFRYLEDEKKFGKYDIVRVKLRDNPRDKRLESRHIDADSIEVVGSARTWSQRAQFVEEIATDTMCGLLRGVTADFNAKSLGAVRPARVQGLKFQKSKPWSKEQESSLRLYADQPALLDARPLPKLLTPPRFEVRLHFFCAEESCRSHTMRIIDWELTALQFHHGRTTDEELEAAIRSRFFDTPFGPKKSPVIIVGNQENPQRRRSFTILGLYYPGKNEIPQSEALF